MTTFCCLFPNQGQCTSVSQEPFIELVPFLAALTMYLTRSSLREQRQILAPESSSVHHGCQRPACPVLSSTGLTNTGHHHHIFFLLLFCFPQCGSGNQTQVFVSQGELFTDWAIWNLILSRIPFLILKIISDQCYRSLFHSCLWVAMLNERASSKSMKIN